MKADQARMPEAVELSAADRKSQVGASWGLMSFVRMVAVAEASILRSVCRTLVKASNALAPRSFFEQCETLRATTAGRRSRSARLLVGSTPMLAEKTQQVAASC